jgi:uncharacterized protein (DUF305 family)
LFSKKIRAAFVLRLSYVRQAVFGLQPHARMGFNMKNWILLFAFCATASVFAADNDRFIVDGKEIVAQSGAKMQRATTTGSADGDFAKLMMLHHQAGIDLANRYLSSSTDRQMRKLAEKMLLQHSAELADLQDRAQALTAVPASYSETQIDSTQDGKDKKGDKDKDVKANDDEVLLPGADPANGSPDRRGVR